MNYIFNTGKQEQYWYKDQNQQCIVFTLASLFLCAAETRNMSLNSVSKMGHLPILCPT